MGELLPAEQKEQRTAAAEARLHPLTLAVIAALTGAPLLSGCVSTGSKEEPVAAASVAQAKAAYMRADYGTAAQMLQGPAMQGDSDAQYALGYMYYYGKGVPQDRNRARVWFEDAAQLGNPDAQRAMKLLQAYGQLPPSPDDPSAKPSRIASRDSSFPETAAAGPSATESAPREVFTYKPQAAPVDVFLASPASSATAVSKAERPSGAASSGAQENAREKGSGSGGSLSPVQPASSYAPGAQSVSAPKVDGIRTSHSADASFSPAMSGRARMQLAKADLGTVSDAGEDEAKPGAAAKSPRVKAPAAVRSSAYHHPRYTVYLVSSAKKSDLLRIARYRALSHKASYYEMDLRNGLRYHLIYGGYATLSAARKALRTLPKALSRNKPWINDFPRGVKLSRVR